VRGFLLDSHIDRAVVDGVKRLSRECEITHLADWRGGLLRNEDDETILLAATKEELMFISYDVNTIPATVARMIGEGRTIFGVALGTVHTVAPNDVGELSRELVRLFAQAQELDPAWPVGSTALPPRPPAAEFAGRGVA